MSESAKRSSVRLIEEEPSGGPSSIETPSESESADTSQLNHEEGESYANSPTTDVKARPTMRQGRKKKPWTPPSLVKEPKVPRPREEGKWKCTECEMTFKKPSLLNSHLESHSDERPYPCPWEGCTSAFKRPQHLDRHYRAHTKDFDFICPWEGCGRGFVEKWLLDDHYRTHLRKKSYVCDYEGCTKSFQTQQTLQAHMAEHGVVRTFACLHADCDASFPRMEALEKHVERFHVAKNYPCIKCQQVFTSRKDLLAHRKDTHGPEFECPHCSKMFHTKAALSKHQVTHNMVRPTFPCPLCDKTFLSQPSMLTHQRVAHEGLREFVCDQDGCGREFAHKKTLIIHLRRDHGLDTAVVTYPMSPILKKAKLEEISPEDASATINLQDLMQPHDDHHHQSADSPAYDDASTPRSHSDDQVTSPQPINNNLQHHSAPAPVNHATTGASESSQQQQQQQHHNHNHSHENGGGAETEQEPLHSESQSETTAFNEGELVPM
jgi:DNA-directed RNA polymerase subunit RPC12/RpoP/ribosomal protein L37AE/L43A